MNLRITNRLVRCVNDWEMSAHLTPMKVVKSTTAPAFETLLISVQTLGTSIQPEDTVAAQPVYKGKVRTTAHFCRLLTECNMPRSLFLLALKFGEERSRDLDDPGHAVRTDFVVDLSIERPLT